MRSLRRSGFSQPVIPQIIAALLFDEIKTVIFILLYFVYFFPLRFLNELHRTKIGFFLSSGVRVQGGNIRCFRILRAFDDDLQPAADFSRRLRSCSRGREAFHSGPL